VGYYLTFQDISSIEFDKLDDFIGLIKFSYLFIVIATILSIVIYYLFRRKRESDEEKYRLQELVDKEVSERLKSSKLFDNIINSTTNTVALLDRDYKFQMVNSAFKSIHAKRDEEVLGKTPPDAGIMTGEFFKQKIEPQLRRVLEGEKLSFRTTIKIDNKEVSLVVQMSPYVVEREAEGIIIVTTDITKEMRLERENLRIQKKAALGELIGIIAHQLKQPLNAIKISKEVLVEEFEYNELTQESMTRFGERIDKNIYFMSHSIDDLRNFFRPDKAPKPFFIVSAIEKALEIIEANISSKGIEILKNFANDAEVNGIESEFEQVIINLLTNGRDVLMEKKPNSPYLKIATLLEDGYIAVTIEDNGGGIAEDIIGKIFDSYFTTKGESGTGIGLNLAKMIVEGSMEGSISVSNTELGALFKIKLPIKNAF